MKSLEEHLLKENELIKNDRSFKELELEKLSQFWTITREQLEDQKHQSIEVEARLQRVKSAHIEQISVSSLPLRLAEMFGNQAFIILFSCYTNESACCN